MTDLERMNAVIESVDAALAHLYEMSRDDSPFQQRVDRRYGELDLARVRLAELREHIRINEVRS